jgi:hypothetical protein
MLEAPSYIRLKTKITAARKYLSFAGEVWAKLISLCFDVQTVRMCRPHPGVCISFCCRTLFEYIYWQSTSQYSYHNSVVLLVPNQFMKNSSFWDIAPRSSLKVFRYFGRKFRLHFQCEITTTWRCKSTIFCYVASYSPVDHRRFGGTYCHQH